MKTLKRIGIIAIPFTFLFAGIGMLLLLRVENAEGTFYQQIQSNEIDWLVAHIILLIQHFTDLAYSISPSFHH